MPARKLVTLAASCAAAIACIHVARAEGVNAPRAPRPGQHLLAPPAATTPGSKSSLNPQPLPPQPKPGDRVQKNGIIIVGGKSATPVSHPPKASRAPLRSK